MIERRIGTISFVVTLTVLLAAFSLTAGPEEDSRAVVGDAERVDAEFLPSVADPTRESAWIELGQGARAQLRPVNEAEGYTVEVVFQREADATGEATVTLEMDCGAEMLSPMGRVPVPMHVELGHERLQVTLTPGQVLRRQVTFQKEVDEDSPMALVGSVKPVASVTVSHGAAVVKDAVFVAFTGPAVRPQPMMGGLPRIPAQAPEPAQQGALIPPTPAPIQAPRAGLAELEGTFVKASADEANFVVDEALLQGN